MSPQRVQRKRTKCWRMPENTVYVGRGSKWGNPYRVVAQFKNGPFDVYHEDWFLGQSTGREDAQRIAVNKYLEARENYRHNIPDDATIQAELKGKNLACWCSGVTPCHADVLLRLANAEDWMAVGNEVRYWPGVRSEHYAPKHGTVLQDGVAIFGGTACVRIRTHKGSSDYIQLSHIEPAP
jgi:GH24 family phage-related lysozyme (muramidase)